jgi:hypothetical protein
MALTKDLKVGHNGTKAITEALKASEYTVTTVPSAAAHKGRIIYVSNGAAGSPCLAYSNGTSWLRLVFGAAVNATT